MEKKRVLITGSNGMTGQKIIYLATERPDIELLATSTGANRTFLKEGYTYQSLDITNQEQVMSIFSDFKPHFVINTAAMTNVDACQSKKQEAYNLNVVGVKNLIGACKKYNTHLIHLSTDFVFDGLKGDLYVEDDLADPVSYYGLTKLIAEEILKVSDIKWANLRTILVYGVVDGNTRNNIVLWTRKAMMNGEKIDVVCDQYRTATLAEDLALGCLQAMDHQVTGTYHVSGKDYMSTFELVQKVADFFGLDRNLVQPITSAALNQPAKRPPKTGFDLSKAKRDFGYAPRSFEEGLQLIKKQLEAYE
jgi:dTDP-4-dehydrorhamnose reductase